MAGDTNFPGSLDDDSSLFDVTDNVTTVQAAHHNNIKEAIKAMQAKIGVDGTSVATALDHRLGHPTTGHGHSGATGDGKPISYNDLTDTPAPGGLGIFELHPSYPEEVRFATQYSGFIYARQGTVNASAWEHTWIYLNADGDTGLAGDRYMELVLNNYTPGGSKYYTKHYFFGGWGIVVPPFATSALHATYSEVGQIFYDTANDKLRVRAGATWRSVAFE